MNPADLAYAAALVDSFGVLRTREYQGTPLPEATIQGKRIAALDWLAQITGVKVTRIGKDYNRHQCAEHCPGQHMHIESFTRRWQITGARATVVLHNLEPFMRVQAREARELVEAGQAIGYKGQVINDMQSLGWTIPPLREQPRARIALTPRSRAIA